MHGNTQSSLVPSRSLGSLPPRDGGGQANAIELRSIAALLWRRKWTIIFTVVVIVALAMLLTSQLSKRYRAVALVAVDSRDSQLVGIETGATGGGADSAVETQVEIARSNAVLGRVARNLDLVNAPDFQSRPGLMRRLLVLTGLGEPPEPEPEQPRTYDSLTGTEKARLIDRLDNRVRVVRRGTTSIIAISAGAGSPDRAAEIANAVANAYLNEELETKLGATQRAALYLQDRVDSLASDIQRIEADIDAFVSQKLSELGSPEAQRILRQLQATTQSRTQNLSALVGLQGALQAGEFTNLLQLVDAPQIDYTGRYEALQTELAALSPGDAGEFLLRSRLSDLEEEVRKAAEVRAEEIRTAIASEERQMSEIRGRLEAVLSSQELPKEVSVELFRLQREAATSRSLYDSYFTKWKQVEQQTDFSLPDSHLVAAAVPPSNPHYPPTRLIAASAVVLAFAAGIGLAFLREYFIGGFTSVRQFEEVTGTRVISTLPRKRKEGEEPVDWSIVSAPLSAFAEGIRKVRLGIEAAVSRKTIVILVTSTEAGEGKTTVSLALARAFAGAGRSTLFIDADLRRPTAQSFPPAAVQDGLFGFLTNQSKLEIIEEPETGLNMVLGTEPSPIATDALLQSERFESLISHAREDFDVIIVDTPPVGLVVDPRIIARHSDIGIYVVRFASTNQSRVADGLRDLADNGKFPVLAVLNLAQESGSYGQEYYAG